MAAFTHAARMRGVLMQGTKTDTLGGAAHRCVLHENLVNALAKFRGGVRTEVGDPDRMRGCTEERPAGRSVEKTRWKFPSLHPNVADRTSTSALVFIPLGPAPRLEVLLHDGVPQILILLAHLVGKALPVFDALRHHPLSQCTTLCDYL
eukprot:2211130-Rhodomonas_salina.1